MPAGQRYLWPFPGPVHRRNEVHDVGSGWKPADGHGTAAEEEGEQGDEGATPTPSGGAGIRDLTHPRHLDTFFHPQCAQSLYSHRLPNGHEIARAHIPHPDHLQ